MLKNKNIIYVLCILIFLTMLLFSCGPPPICLTEDSKILSTWITQTIPFQMPSGYEAKYGFNFIPIGNKMKMATLLPITKTLGNGEISPDSCTGFEIIICPNIKDYPDLAGSYYFHRMKHTLGYPNKNDSTKQIAIQVGEKQLQANLFEWQYKKVFVVRYQIFLNQDVQIIAVGPKNEFDDTSFKELINSLSPDAPTNYSK